MLRLYDVRRGAKAWVEPTGGRLHVRRLPSNERWRALRVAVVADTIRRVATYNGGDAIVMAETVDTLEPALDVVTAESVASPADVLVGDSTQAPFDGEVPIVVGVGPVVAEGLDLPDASAALDVEPAAFRFLCLRTPYRTTLTLDEQALASAGRQVSRLRRNVQHWQQSVGPMASGEEPFVTVQGRRFVQEFRAAIDDDLALDVALSVVQQAIDHDMGTEEKLRLLLEFDRVLGLRLDRSG